jgi:toxin HigB-1
MIRSFSDKPTQALFWDEFVRQFQGIARPAKRKIEAINAASRLEDLKVPPANRLEKLRGNLKDFYSIRTINGESSSNGWMARLVTFGSSIITDRRR